MKIYYRLFSYLKPYKFKIIFVFILILIFSISTLILPWLVKNLFQRTIIEKNKSILLPIILIFIIVLIIKTLAEYYKGYFMAEIGQKVIYNLRNELFSHIQYLDLKFYANNKTGEIISRFLNDITVLNTFMGYTIVELVTEPLIFIGSLIFLFYLHWKLTLLSLFIGPFALYTIISLGHQMKNFSERLQIKFADITSILQEAITNIKIIKAFATEKDEIKKFQDENKNNFILAMKTLKILTLLSPLIEFLGSMSIIFMMWYGGKEAIKGNLTPGNLIAFILYLTTISRPLRVLGGCYQRIQQSLVASKRIFEFLDTKQEIKENENAIFLPTIQGKVEFKQVYFAYEEQNMVLKNITFTAEPKKIIALVGSSGSGKTTIINLLLRFYDPLQGEITIDGYNLKEIKLESLRNQISLVTQENILFSGTIKENILYGKKDATFEEIQEAAKIANAHNFILNFPLQYNTQIGEKGVKLSGGEKQRISIARALIKKPKILILDEATSALDTESEKLIQDALFKIIHQQTTFIIAHRLSTIISADKIVVIDKGEILTQGTHQELLTHCKLYKKLVKMQFEL